MHKESELVDYKMYSEKASSLSEKFLPPFTAIHPAPNDLMNIDVTGNYSSDNMQNGYIATESSNTLINSPINSGPFYAFRSVDVSPVGHILVNLREMHPVQGRTWSNMYDINFGWRGWVEQNAAKFESIRCEQIWLNSSWSSAFPGQTVTFTQPAYPDVYIVSFVADINYGYQFSIAIPRIGAWQSLSGICHLAVTTTGGHTWPEASRMVQIHGDGTGATFLSARTTHSYPDQCCIPYSISGIYLR